MALIFGTISRNMVKRGWNNNIDNKKIEKIPLAHKEMIERQWALYISYDEISYAKFHILQQNDFTPKEIKSLLIKDIAITLKDLEAIQNSEIPRKPFHKHNIKMHSGYIILSLFKSQSPTQMLTKWVTLDDDKTKNHVIWSTFSETDEKLNEQFLCAEETTYQDFLIFISKYVSEIKNEGYRIEFELFVFNIPVVFGRATCISTANDSVDCTFFFSRVVSASTMPKEYYRGNHHN